MVDKTKLMGQTERGSRSEIALEEFNRVFEDLKANCYETFKASDSEDHDGRFRVWAYERVLRDIESRFTVAIRNGETARKQLADINKPQLRKV